MTFNDYLLNFYNEFFDYEYLDFDEDGKAFINDKVWKKLYDTEMLYVKEYIKENLNELLDKVNFILLKELWDKYGKGSLSHWEMDSMCFYYHDHELKYVNKEKYGIVDFDSLSEEPEVDKSFTRGNITYNTYNLHSIIGTVIGKNDTKSIVTLLTVNGDVVSVKFTREYYARYNKQISELNMDGTKSIVEKSWFTRGSLIMVTGFRRGDQFISKTYKKTLVHQLYKILNVDENGNITLKHNRYGEISNEE
jgi:DNA polymerase-3 subunit alpha